MNKSRNLWVDCPKCEEKVPIHLDWVHIYLERVERFLQEKRRKLKSWHSASKGYAEYIHTMAESFSDFANAIQADIAGVKRDVRDLGKRIDFGFEAVLADLKGIKEFKTQTVEAVDVLMDKKLEEYDRRLKRLEKHAGIK